jgi:hypothetical protein
MHECVGPRLVLASKLQHSCGDGPHQTRLHRKIRAYEVVCRPRSLSTVRESVYRSPQSPGTHRQSRIPFVPLPCYGLLQVLFCAWGTPRSDMSSTTNARWPNESLHSQRACFRHSPVHPITYYQSSSRAISEETDRCTDDCCVDNKVTGYAADSRKARH